MERDRVEAYHLAQYDEMYRKTASLLEFASVHLDEDRPRILDVGCGAAADAHYFSREHPDWEITGVDLDPSLIDVAREKNAGNDRLNFEVADMNDLPERYGPDSFTHVFSIQFLATAPVELTDFVDVTLDLATEGVMVHSLFTEGHIEQYSQTKNLDDGWEAVYKIFSLDRFADEVHERAPEAEITYERFDIDVDLPKPDEPLFKTYTVTTESGDRLQISGYMLMPWYNVYIDLT